MDIAKEFRRLTQETHQGRDRRGRRYSKSARQMATRYCREQRAKGRAFSEIARDLGINTATLGCWLDSDVEPPAAVGFREVAVVEEPPIFESPGIRVVLANGLQIEGLQRNEICTDLGDHPSLGRGERGPTSQQLGQSRALHAETLGSVESIRRGSPDPARQQRGRAGLARPGGGSEGPLRLEIEAGDGSGGGFLYAAGDREAPRRESVGLPEGGDGADPGVG